jgi:tetraacyldisaccharide 4'-kinase
MDDADAAAALRQRHGEVFLVRRRTVGVTDTAGTPQPVPARPLLLSAVARPERFEADARALCGDVVAALRFRDHHHWTDADLRALWIDRVRGSGADAILTTAKDAVRLPARLGELPVRVLAQRVDIEDEPRLLARVLAAARA